MSHWDGVDEFVAVATTRSFTRAARAIGMSPTHVSRAVRLLEQRVQAQLFHRTTRTVQLTDTGRTLFERCQRLAEERDEVIALISQQGEPQGELRITCSTTLGERFVVPILRDLAMHYPRLSIAATLTNRVVDLLAEGFDLAVRTGPVADPRLISVEVASRTLYTCASPGYLARAGMPADIADLAAHECLIGTSQSWQFRRDGKDMIHRPSGRFRCNSGQAVMEACLAGMGICQLPDIYILPHLRRGEVQLVLGSWQPDPEPICAVYPQQRHLLPKISRSVEWLQRQLAEALTRGKLPGNAIDAPS
jgi:DNA-binding transcriptional LysR family regulator